MLAQLLITAVLFSGPAPAGDRQGPLIPDPGPVPQGEARRLPAFARGCWAPSNPAFPPLELTDTTVVVFERDWSRIEEKDFVVVRSDANVVELEVAGGTAASEPGHWQLRKDLPSNDHLEVTTRHSIEHYHRTKCRR